MKSSSTVVAITDRADFSSHGFSTGKRMELDEVLAQLLADGLINDDEAKRTKVARTTARNDVHPLVLIANAKYSDRRDTSKALTLESLTEWLAGRAGLDYMKIDPTKIDVIKVGQIVAPSYAARYRILPVAITEATVTFATSEPFDTRWEHDLGQMLRREIKRVVANPLDVNRFLMEFYGVTRSVRKAKDNKDEDGRKILPNFEQLIELGNAGDVNAEDSHVVRIVDWLLQYAYEQRASDIHMEPRREISPIRFRIDGVLHKVFELPTPVMIAVVSRVKILGRLDIAERRRPQDGRIKTRSPGGREVEMRLSTMPTAFGEKVVLRIFDPDVVIKTFAEIGFSTKDEGVWKGMIEQPHGVVLVTGPTGSGKTTTLYATLKYLAKPDLNVCTVEDPIEMIAPELNQMQVQTNIDLTFAAGVRTLLRQDPDIIMVGEIRDLPTAEMAVQASLTGHLVLSTLHTNDAPSAVTRLLDLGVPHYLIQSTLNGVIAQRLVRRLCSHCRTVGEVSDEVWASLVHNLGLKKPARVAAPKGCNECRHTGYLGRSAIYEQMPITSALRKGITSNLDLPAFQQLALKDGMRPLRYAAAEIVARGITTVREVIEVLPPPE